MSCEVTKYLVSSSVLIHMMLFFVKREDPPRFSHRRLFIASAVKLKADFKVTLSPCSREKINEGNRQFCDLSGRHDHFSLFFDG